jgi:hypothetical protein
MTEKKLHNCQINIHSLLCPGSKVYLTTFRILYIGPSGQPFWTLGHIHKLKTICGQEKNKNLIYLNYLLCKKILFRTLN